MTTQRNGQSINRHLSVLHGKKNRFPLGLSEYVDTEDDMASARGSKRRGKSEEGWSKQVYSRLLVKKKEPLYPPAAAEAFSSTTRGRQREQA